MKTLRILLARSLAPAKACVDLLKSGNPVSRCQGITLQSDALLERIRKPLVLCTTAVLIH